MDSGFYIVIDEECIYIHCKECYKIDKRGSFWPKSNGFGPIIKCNQCKKLIHEEEGYGKEKN